MVITKKNRNFAGHYQLDIDLIILYMKNNLLSTLFVAALLLLASSISAADLTGKRIYVDPGHGAWGLNSRPMPTIPHPNKYSYTNSKGTSWMPDTTGFFETNTNLWKCLYLGEKLKKAGAEVIYSHTQAGPNPYPYIKDGKFDWTGYQADEDYTRYFRVRSQIGQEVGNMNLDKKIDYFISVHSNAPITSENQDANYPLFLYRGFDRENSHHNNPNNSSVQYYSPGSYEMAAITWKYAYELIEGISSLCHPTVGETPSIDKMLIRGDLDYYYDESKTYSTGYGLHVDIDTLTFAGTEYYSYLGVIRHMVPGFLVEGYHHTYGPARHRALNRDYCNMEGLAYFRGIMEYFEADPEKVGYICGVIKDNNTPAPDNVNYRFHPDSHDQWMPCNGATVILKKDGKAIRSYTCDDNYNGIFVFYELDPGTYVLESEHNGLTFSEVVEVEADKTTYSRLYPTTTPHICAYDLNVEKNGDSYTFSFYANSTAENANIIFYNNEKEKIGSYPISAVKGTNSITLSTLALPGDAGQTLSWAVELTGKEITEFALIHSDNSLDMSSTSQLFNAVNTNPMSDNFGEIYVLHRAGRLKQEPTAAANNGLWVYNHELTKQNTVVYKGGSPFGHPTRMSIDSEGYLYISDWSGAQSGIHIANTADLSQPFAQFYAGTRDSDGKFTYNSISTGSATSGNYIYGTGKDTKLYVCDEQNANNGIAIYNIGQEDGAILRRWEKAADKIIEYQGTTGGNSAVWATSKGVFISQHRANYAQTHPSLQFYDNEGTLTFSSDNTNMSDGSNGGGFAVSPDEKMLIISTGEATKRFKVFNITWNNNTPTLTSSTTYYHGLGAIRQMNWDYAGNLVCSGDDGIHIFTVPTNDNITLVPARTTITKEQPALAPATQRIWAFDLKQKPTMTGYQFTFKSVTNGVGSLILKDEQCEALKSFDLPSVTQGENTFTIPYDDMPQTRDDLSWEITLAAGAVEQGAILKEITTDMAKFHYYFPQGVAINNNPNSEHFGKIYIANTQKGTTEYNSNNVQTVGIYVLDALLNAENYNTSGYIPHGVDVEPTQNYTHRTLHRIAVNPKTDDVAFVQSKKSQLWVANPDNLNAAATNFGLNTYASSLCYDADGALYIFGYEAPEDVQYHKTNAIIYKKVGNSALQEFVAIDGWESLNERNSMASDGRGGLWVVSKFVGNDNHYANFFHVNPNTTVDINITTDGTTLNAKTIKGEMPANMPKNFDRGHVAYDAQHNVLALGGESKVALFRVTYDANNIPTLVYWTSTPTLGTNIDGIAFDYAGDLVVLSASTERFYKFAVPTDNNVCTTPAPTSQIIPYRFVLQETKDNQAALDREIGQEVDALVCRSLTAGMFNTLCLPFNASLTEGPLAGAKAYTFTSSSETDGGDILLHFSKVENTMKAGTPYLIEPQTNIQGPIDFTNVTISESEGGSAGSDIKFNGILAPKWLEATNKNILFLVSDNKLAWANANANMNGMRAYFSLPDGAYNKLNTRARIVVSENTTTDIQQTTTTSTNAQKLIQNGMLYILKDGQLYTVFGTKVK